MADNWLATSGISIVTITSCQSLEDDKRGPKSSSSRFRQGRASTAIPTGLQICELVLLSEMSRQSRLFTFTASLTAGFSTISHYFSQCPGTVPFWESPQIGLAWGPFEAIFCSHEIPWRL